MPRRRRRRGRSGLIRRHEAPRRAPPGGIDAAEPGRLKLERLTSGQARRIALAAQGFRRDRPGRSGARHLERMFERLGLVQIDSVNVLARAHYVPFYSRSGAYDAVLLDRAAYGKRRALFEYWGHEASLLRLDLYPLMRWRMERAARSEGIYGGLARFAAQARRLVGLERRQARARMAVLERARHHGVAPRLRARLRSYGARPARPRRVGTARRGRRCAARPDHGRGARPRRRDGAGPARLFPA